MPKTTNAPYPCETTTNRLYAERHVTKPENRSHRIRMSEKVLTAVRLRYLWIF